MKVKRANLYWIINIPYIHISQTWHIWLWQYIYFRVWHQYFTPYPHPSLPLLSPQGNSHNESKLSKLYIFTSSSYQYA